MKCNLVFCAQEKNDQWHMDNACSHCMIEDKRRFISLNNISGGNVILGDDRLTKVIGRSKFCLDNKNTNVDNVLLV